MENQKMIIRLQGEASDFIRNRCILIGGVTVYPKEIEVYYFKQGEFEDNSVHRNDLQKNNKNHLYVHRRGTAYRGGNHAGADLVISDKDDFFYSYLLRSVAFGDEELVSGPHRVLVELCKRVCTPGKTEVEMYEELENVQCQIAPNGMEGIRVGFSERINLSESVNPEYKEAELRAVAIDQFFRKAKYHKKEKMITGLIKKELEQKIIGKEEAEEIVKDKLGYVPDAIKSLLAS